MPDSAPRFGMILLDATPTILQAYGRPLVFQSTDETVEYARLHNVQRWMVYGDPEGWWPIFTQDGPVNPPPSAKERIDISLHKNRK
jgi:hypothetical protein